MENNIRGDGDSARGAGEANQSHQNSQKQLRNEQKCSPVGVITGRSPVMRFVHPEREAVEGAEGGAGDR